MKDWLTPFHTARLNAFRFSGWRTPAAGEGAVVAFASFISTPYTVRPYWAVHPYLRESASTTSWSEQERAAFSTVLSPKFKAAQTSTRFEAVGRSGRTRSENTGV